MKKGFTLIEMAVVLLIIGVLVGIVLRNLGTQPIQARDIRRIADLHTISTYLVQYMTKQGSFPSSTSITDLSSKFKDAGITVPLPNPPSGNPYYYYPCSDAGGTSNSPNHFILKAVLEQSFDQAPKIYEGSSGAKPSDWSCNGAPDCSTSTGNNYCFIQ